jgi:hydroxymethylpyrimidine pyrophosphatase-like HAD family hydrolase
MLIALDVDGTLFDGSGVAPAAIAALQAARQSGHIVMIVTGRRADSLIDVVAEVLPLCDTVVAEDGGVLVDLATGAVELLAPRIDDDLIDALVAAGVTDLDVGMVAVGAPRGFEAQVRAVNDARGADRHVLVNKGSVTLVPPGCHKGTGLRAAVARLGEPAPAILAIGDASNDLPMFAVATIAVGVANADDDVRASGIVITRAAYGDGVAEALDRFLPDPSPRT